MFITDGGIETTLIFHEGVALRQFAAFELLNSREGTALLDKYFRAYCAIAERHQMGIVLESATWRANPDWAGGLGYDAKALDRLNRRAIEMLTPIRRAYASSAVPVVISGAIGPRGDGYQAHARMSAAEAAEYHSIQVRTFADTEADMVAAFTLTYIEEAIGVAEAARAHTLPVAIAFTVETDGRLPSGDTLEDAITRTDRETGGYPAYYMINCAHPTHFERALDGAWTTRVRGIRANASRRSHAELAESADLDAGNPLELGADYVRLSERLPNLRVVGGCCGTDHRHVDAICESLSRSPTRAPATT